MVTVVFVLLLLAGVLAALAEWSARGNQSLSLSVRESRANAAAMAAAQWAAWQVIDPTGTLFPGATTLPDCFASPRLLNLPAPLDTFTVQVSCSRLPASPGYYEEDGRRLAVFVLNASVSEGAPGTSDRVERTVELRAEACKDPAGTGPTWRC